MGHSQAYQDTRTTATDSLFGMVLAQSFTGMVLGTGAETAWEAAEIGSEVYTERHRPCQVKRDARTNGNFELGVKNSLSPVFCAQTRPCPAPAQPHPDHYAKYLPNAWEIDAYARPRRARGLHL